ncbi:MAG: Gfo/Idh/MocA family oxidoreductase, partial [Chloroflexi bacterium]
MVRRAVARVRAALHGGRRPRVRARDDPLRRPSHRAGRSELGRARRLPHRLRAARRSRHAGPRQPRCVPAHGAIAGRSRRPGDDGHADPRRIAIPATAARPLRADPAWRASPRGWARRPSLAGARPRGHRVRRQGLGHRVEGAGVSRRLRVGLVSFAHVHATALAGTLRSLGQVEFTGIHDEDPARGRAAAEEHGARWHETLDGLLAASEAVVIASTNFDRRRYTEAAAAKGVHVLSEKPLATTVVDGRAMIDACRRAGVQLGVAFPVRSSPAVIALREAIAGGVLGRIRAVRATNPGQYPGSWFGDKRLAGGGAVMDHTVHAADVIRWLVSDEFVRVQAELGAFIYGLEVEDCGILSCDLAGGAFASIDCSWSRPQTFPTWGGVTLHVVGDRGTVDIDVFRQAL